MRLTPLGACVLTLPALSAFIVAGGGFDLLPLAVAAGVAVLLLFDAFALTPKTSVKARALPLPNELPVGRPFELSWRLSAPPSGKLRIPVHLSPHEALGCEAETQRRTLASRGSILVTQALRPRERGLHPLPAPRVELRGQLWLTRRTCSTGKDLVIAVGHDTVPSTVHLRSGTPAPSGAARLMTPLASAEGTEIERLREWRTGDSLRRLDRKATARLGRPIVRELRSEVRLEIRLVLDAGRLAALTWDGPPLFDHLARTALHVGAALAAEGHPVGLLVIDDRVRIDLAPASGQRAITNLRRALNRITPRPVATAHRDAARHLGRQRRPSHLVWLSDLGIRDVAQELVEGLPHLARHELLVAAPIDEDSFVTKARPSDATSLVEYANRLEDHLARRQSLDDLQRSGCRVIRAPTPRLARTILANLDPGLLRRA